MKHLHGLREASQIAFDHFESDFGDSLCRMTPGSPGGYLPRLAEIDAAPFEKAP
jgi:hypothetical protein